MLTNAVPKMRLLLLKSEGQFKHSGKYFLHLGRWHKLHQDKPVPKGAAVAAHPHAAGAPVAGGVFTDDEWKQVVSQFKLDIDPSNTNASDVIKKLNSLKHMADTGDVTGILGSTYGTNSYSKNKIVPLANYILGKLGSTHTVSAGQKAGTHAAVQGAPEVAAAVEAPAPAAEQGPKDGDTKEGAKGQQLVFKDGRWHKVVAADEHGELPPALVPVDDNPEDAAPEPASQALAMPAFQEGKTVTGVVAYYEKVGQKVLDLAAAGDVAALEQMKADGLKPNHKGKVSNTWAGKTPNSKLLLAMHAEALQHAGKAAAVQHLEQDQKQADIPAGEKAEDKQLVAEIKDKPAGEAVAAALDHLKGDEGQDNLPAAEKKEDAALVRKLEAAQGVSGAGNMTYEQFKQQMQSLLSQAHKYKPGQIGFNDYSAKMAELADKYPEFDAKLDEESANQPAATPAAKEPRLVLPKKAPDQNPIKNAEPAAATVSAAPAPSAGKLDQIPWDAQLLPAENKNAKSHNKQVEKIKGLAYAGDIAGLEALKFGTNTYAKKQELLKQTALAALKEGGQQSQGSTSADLPSVDTVTEPAASAGQAQPISSVRLKETQQHVELSLSGKIANSGSASAAYQVAIDYVSSSGSTPKSVEEAKNALEDHGFWTQAAQLHAAFGPKEGDTKQGADGMLVLKDGHWVKVEQDKPAVQQPAGVDSVQIPDFASLSPGKWGEAYQKVAEHLKQLVATGGVDALKGVVINHQDGKFTIKAAGYNLKKVGPDGISDPLAEARRKAMHKFITELKAAVGKPKKVSKPKAAPAAAPAPAASAPVIESMDTWTQTGPQGGSNPGGRFKDPDGVEWYCKFPADEDTAKAEVLAAKLYAALGIAGQDAKLITKGGKVGIASKWVSVSKVDAKTLIAADWTQSGFGADAWLANWDVIGQWDYKEKGYDNLQIGADGKAHRVDAGGSLMYRAQGGKKAFGNIVTEIDSLRDPKINPQAAAVFGGMTEADITASVAKVLALSDAQINTMVMMYGPGDEAAKKALAATLIARKQDLANKFPKAVKAKPLKAQFDPLKITPPPNFFDFKGQTGKGYQDGGPVSSKDYINSANQAAVDAAYAAAKEGNLNAIKNVQAPVFNKDSGQIASHVALAQHPSQHVKAYWSDLVEEVDLQLNPPRPPEIGEIVLSSDLAEISAMLAPVPSGDPVALVGKHKKVGEYIMLGKVANPAPIIPKESDALIGSDVWKQKAKDAYHAAPSEAKNTFSAYLPTSGARAMNTALRTGNLKAAVSGKTIAQHVKDFKGLLLDIPEGSTFVRRMGMKGYGQSPNPKAIKELQQFLMTAEPGTVLQEPGFSSTSWSGGNKILGNNDIEWEFVASKGVKMYPGWLTANAGEGEGLLPPNQRYMIVSSKKEGKTVRVKAILLPTIE